MRISDWSSDVCSSDLQRGRGNRIEAVDSGDLLDDVGGAVHVTAPARHADAPRCAVLDREAQGLENRALAFRRDRDAAERFGERRIIGDLPRRDRRRSEEHTSELQSLMRISYAVFCLKKQTQPHQYPTQS